MSNKSLKNLNFYLLLLSSNVKLKPKNCYFYLFLLSSNVKLKPKKLVFLPSSLLEYQREVEGRNNSFLGFSLTFEESRRR
jgi:hypothetical protein